MEALEAASLHPAQMLRVEGQKGSLAYGSDADLVVLTDDLDVIATFISGELVWEKADAKKFVFKHRT